MADKRKDRPRKSFSLWHAEEKIIVVTTVQSISFKPDESSKPITGKQEMSSSSRFDIIHFCSLGQHLVLQIAQWTWYLLSRLARIGEDAYYLFCISRNTGKGEWVSFLLRWQLNKNSCSNVSFDFEYGNYMAT